VPAHIDASLTLADLAAHRAADTLRKLYSGKPVHASEIGRQLGVTPTTAIRWLQRAATLGLAQCTNSGWEPL
jgi:predicted ArsR family transcriptional regulator